VPSALSPRVLAIAIAGIAAAGLTACSPGGADPDPTPTATQRPSPTATADPGATGEPTAQPVVGRHIDLDCAELLPRQSLDDYAAGFVPQDSYQPEEGSHAALIVRENGLACGWANAGSGETIDVAVADMPDDSLVDVKNGLLESSNPVPTYGDEAYFEAAHGVGTAEVFSGSYWIVAASETFYEPGDAAPIVEAVLSSLGE